MMKKALLFSFLLFAFTVNSQDNLWEEVSFTAGDLSGTSIAFSPASTNVDGATITMTVSNISSTNIGSNIITIGASSDSDSNTNLEIDGANVNKEIVSGTGTGDFSADITGLTENTEYHYKAYATNSAGTSYGVAMSFTTVTAPTVSTTSASNVTPTYAILGGAVTSAVGETIMERGIVYSSSNINPEIGGTNVNQKIVSGTEGAFSKTVTGLTANIVYYYRAYATNGSGETGYGAVKRFTSSNNSLRFGSIVTIRDNSAFDFSNGFTAEAWIYPTGITFSGSYLFKKSLSENEKVAFEVVLGDNKEIDYSISTAGSDVMHLFSSSKISLNTWTHIAVTFDGVIMKIYINGALNKSKELDSAVVMYDSDSDITISDYTNNFLGDIDEVRFWGKALTQEKISRQKDCKIPANTLGLIAYYNFNQGTAGSDNTGITTLTDVGINGLDGILRASTLTDTDTSTSNFVSNVPRSFNNNAVCNTPSLTTKSANLVTPVSAILGGTITSNSGEIITERGIVYSSEISTNTDLIIDADNVIKDSNGAGIGDFSKIITGLAKGTQYYYRAYATNTSGTAYGDLERFRTQFVGPLVSTTNPMSITFSSVTLGGTITNVGESVVKERGIVYSSDDTTILMHASENANVITETISGTGLGIFSKTIQNLMTGTTYRYRAYAINNEGTSHGDVRYFTTYIERPTVTTTAANTILSTSVILGGTIKDSGKSSVIEIGIVYSSDETAELIIGDETNIITETISGTQSDNFSKIITSLTAKTPYYYKAYATNGQGTSYGDKETFTTTTKPTVITDKARNTLSSSITLGGIVVSGGGHSIIERGFVYSSDDTTDLIIGAENVTKGVIGAGLGDFEKIFAGFTESTTYRYRAYATNVNGTSYGKILSFTTINFKPLVATGDADIPKELVSISVVTLNGSIENSGVGILIEVGFVYSKTISTETDLIIGPDDGVIRISDHAPGGGREFSGRASLRVEKNEIYYYRAYAVNDRGLGYGNIRNFIIRNAPPIILVNNPSHRLIEGATETFELADVFSNADSYSVIEAQKPSFVTLEGSVLTFTPPPPPPSFVGAADNSPYTFQVSAGNYLGEVSVNFTLTVDQLALEAPTVNTTSETLVTSTSATLNGGMTSNGGETITERGFVYSTSNTNLEIGGANVSKEVVIGTGTGDFSADIAGLTENTEYHYKAYATNSAGTSYGVAMSFTTVAAPTVNTTSETLVTSTSATLNGGMTSNGGETITERGFVYSTSNTNLEIGGANVNKEVVIGTGTGVFSTDIAGLTENTEYHYKAYATNSAGTSYGVAMSFTTPVIIILPTVTTTSETLVTSTSATLNGGMTSNGGETITERGFVYSTSNTNLKIGGANVNKEVIIGTETGDFSADIASLTENTEYHYKAYATNSAGTSYGVAMSFTTVAAPTVTTTSETLVTSTSATLNGGMTSNGGETITERGFVYSTSNTNLEIGGANVSKEIVIGTGTGDFSADIAGLTENTEYHYKAYATNSAGTSYGVAMSFTTPVIIILPTVNTTSETLVTSTSATLNGGMTSNGGETITERGFVYSTSNTNLEIGGANVSKEVVSGIGTGDFSKNITGLTENTEYHYKAYATNSAGTSYGVAMSFTTPVIIILPTVNTTSETLVTSTSATLNGGMTSNGGETITERGFVYSTSNTNLEIDRANVNKEVVIGTGTGDFSTDIASLTENTEYHYKAYATNSAGTSYGVAMSFTTVAAPTVTTTSETLVTSTSATLNGGMTSNGGETITERGFVYSTSNTNLEIGGANVSKEIVIGTGTGDFSADIAGLTENTEYHYKAYATNSAGTSYGVAMSFTTVAAPTVTTTSETLVTSTSATLNGGMTSNGGETITERGFVYSTSNTNLEIGGANVSKEVVIGTGTGVFSADIAGLTENTEYHYKAYATNSAGTSYGVAMSFTTPVIIILPTVNTTSETLVTSTSATLNGGMTSNGGETITERGFVYSTSNTNLKIGGANVNKEVVIGTGTGDFSTDIASLTENTEYHYKAYATNSAGTSYGVAMSFTTVAAPTVTTTSETLVTSTSATLNGGMTSNGGETITERGFVYSTSNTNLEIGGANVSKEIVIGTGTGDFSADIAGLTENTEYHYKAYATNSAGTSYGVAMSFTTVAAPTVTTTSETLVTSTSATLNGGMTSNGGETITERGFVYSTSNTNLEIGGANVNKEVVSGIGTGDFSADIAGLTENTEYHYKAYATNSAGTSYGVAMSFTTPVIIILPTVNTTSETLVTSTSATLNGGMTSNGGETITERGFVYSTSNTNLEIGGTNVSKEVVSGTGTGVFSADIAGLTENTEYHYKAYATNSAGTSYGVAMSFTTPVIIILPTVNTTSETLVTSISATLNGGMTSNGGETITERGFVYSTSNTNLEIGGTNVSKEVVSGTGTGVFSADIAGLTENTEYHYKAYATNSAGTSYGVAMSFTTVAAPTVNTTSETLVTSTSATLNGGMTSNGGETITERGFVYSTSNTNLEIGGANVNKEVVSGIGTGVFSTDIASLTENTEYHYKAYATNSAGTSYGVAMSFTTVAAPTVNTTSETLVTSTSATLNGGMTSNGGETITERGFVYSTSNTNLEIGGTNVNKEVVIGTGTGVFSADIAGLTENTEYHYKAYATNSAGTSYGVAMSFTTPVIIILPTVNTTSETLVTSISATLNGGMTSNGGETITERGFVYSTSNTNLEIGGTNVNKEVVIGTGTGVFSADIAGLTENTEYHYKAYATNSAGTSYGVAMSFTTPVIIILPTVNTTSETLVTSISATLNGGMTSNGGETITERGFVYSTSNTNLKIGGANVNKEVIIGTGTGVFSADIAGLTENTEYHYKAYATNSAGTSYGVAMSFTTPVIIILPTVNTTSETLVTSISATLNGGMTSNGGETITERGFVYSTSNTNLEIGGTNVNKEVVIGTGTGVFSADIAGLTENTEYHYKAYATNSAGTSYGVAMSFTTPVIIILPTVNTTSETLVTSISATVNGGMTSNGGETITERGFVYSTSNTNLEIGGANVSKEVVSGTGTGVFSADIAGLTENTEYHYKAYATNSAGTSYGVAMSFTTPVIIILPTVTTTSETLVTSTSATLNGGMTSNGGETITERGFVYSTSNTNLEIDRANVNKEVVSGTGTGDFSADITSLTENTEYHYKAYATNSAGTSYGVAMSFTTVAAPTVNTTSETLVTSTSATLNGGMTSNGGETITERGFVYSTSNTNLEIDRANVNKEVVSGTGTGDFSADITSLTENTEYHYKAYATNSAGTSYGVAMSFTTPVIIILPTVNTTSETLVTSTSATLNGGMTSNGGETITERGFVYSTSNTNLEIDRANVNKEVVSGTGTGDFSADITSLTENTEYHYKAYATNSAGTSYGVAMSFTTPVAPVTPPTIMNMNVDSTGQTITMQTSKPVTLTNVDNQDFTVTSTLNNVITTHQVTSIASGSIILTVTPAIPSGATVSVSYDPTQGSSTDAITDSEGNSMSSFTNVMITNGLSNEDFEKTSFSVSPNPARGILNITVVEKADYRLLNIRGQILKKGVLATGESKINISSLARGVYFLNIKTSKGSFTGKIVKN